MIPSEETSETLGIPFLARLTSGDRSALLSEGRECSWLENDTIIHQGDPSDYVVMLVHGYAKSTMVDERGYEAVLKLYATADIVGVDGVFLKGNRRTMSVRCLTKCRGIVLSGDHFRTLLERNPSIAFAVLGEMTYRLREGDRKRLWMASRSVRERLADTLLELARKFSVRDRDGLRIAVPLSQRDLAGMLGSSREAVAKLFKELRDKGVVATRYREIVIVRPDVLRRMRHW
ncbi:Crp/Fnr family transcriptional regulator [Streptomyces sp. NPDC088560]|uniref:Crp/Fnr family transcriptional regulator n=1 Tax=Streptomyces sp. NPDC088560 TaxID=3365868 RepID=UPI00382BF5CA